LALKRAGAEFLGTLLVSRSRHGVIAVTRSASSRRLDFGGGPVAAREAYAIRPDPGVHTHRAVTRACSSAARSRSQGGALLIAPISAPSPPRGLLPGDRAGGATAAYDVHGKASAPRLRRTTAPGGFAAPLGSALGNEDRPNGSSGRVSPPRSDATSLREDSDRIVRTLINMSASLDLTPPSPAAAEAAIFRWWGHSVSCGFIVRAARRGAARRIVIVCVSGSQQIAQGESAVRGRGLASAWAHMTGGGARALGRHLVIPRGATC